MLLKQHKNDLKNQSLRQKIKRLRAQKRGEHKQSKRRRLYYNSLIRVSLESLNKRILRAGKLDKFLLRGLA